MSNDTSTNPDDGLDEAIDRAVREMVQLEPRTGLRRRVLARIAEPPRRGMFLPRFALAAAGVAAAMLVVLLVGRDAPAPATVSVARPVAPPPAASARAQPARVDANKISADTALVPPVAAPRDAPTVAKRRGPTSEPIAIPPVANVFGPRDNRAAAANMPEPRAGLLPGRAGGTSTEPPALSVPPLSEELRPAPAGRPSISISIELTIVDQSGSSEPVKNVITMIVADRQRGSVRNGIVTTAPEGSTAVPPLQQGGGTLNVDAVPSIRPDGAILVSLALEYAPRPGVDDARGPSPMSERMDVVVESGKGVVISQASDARNNGRVTVELKATILRQQP